MLLLTPTPTPDVAPGYSFGDTFQLIAVLLVMIAVIAGAYFLTRLIAGGAMRMQKRLARMQVVDRMMLARDRAVVVIELGGRYYMVGVGATVTLMTEVDAEPYRGDVLSAGGGRGGGGSFFAALQDKLRRNGGVNDSPYRVGGEPSSPPAGSQQEELERAVERMRARTKSRPRPDEENERDDRT